MDSKITDDVKQPAAETKAPDTKEELTDEQLAAVAAGRLSSPGKVAEFRSIK